MQERIAVRFVVFILLGCFASQVKADIIPPIGLAPGSEYQLIFVTGATTNAESTDISTYNTFVTNEAALNPLLPSATWNAIGSTATVNASDNAPNVMVGDSYLPVYNTQGIEVSGAAGLYSGTLSSPVLYDQSGSEPGSNILPWTGTSPTGVVETNAPLGSPDPAAGDGRDVSNAWLFNTTGTSFTERYVYALSTPIFATPG